MWSLSPSLSLCLSLFHCLCLCYCLRLRLPVHPVAVVATQGPLPFSLLEINSNLANYVGPSQGLSRSRSRSIYAVVKIKDTASR